MTVTEKQLDEKHRVTVPVAFAASVKDNKVLVVSYDDQAIIITGDRRVADELSDVLARWELRRKLEALDKWQGMIEKAGLSNLTARQIDLAVARELKGRTDNKVKKGKSRSSS